MIAVCLPITVYGCTVKKSLQIKTTKSEETTSEKTASKEAIERDKDINQKVNAKPAELTGEVIDAWCYCSKVMGDGRGPSHEKCAKLCVAGGVSAGILTDDGTVYIAAKHQGYKGCNGLLLPYVAKRVKVKGWIAERGGIKVVKIREVELVDKEENKESKDSEPEKEQD